MRKWLIRQDHPSGGMLSFVGKPAFRAHWALSADPPTEFTAQPELATGEDQSYWFRTGEGEDDIVVQFSELHWQDSPPEPERLRRLMAQAVNLIDKRIGERF